MSSSEPLQNKTWDLSLYELNRLPQEPITDATEIAVSPRSLHSELMCPICLDMLKDTMTTKECLHRFCSKCINQALSTGKRECPPCRKKLVSRRSLRPDPNFDLLISKLYPSRDEYEAHQERVLAKFNQTHSQVALVHSITEGIKLQTQYRQQRTKKNQDSDRNENEPSVRSTPSPVPSNQSSSTSSKAKRPRLMLTSERSEESESNSEVDYSRTEGNDSNIDTEGEGTSEIGASDEIELLFKPHPTEMSSDNQLMKALKENSVRYLKTTENATVDHLGKYLAMRLTLDLESEIAEAERMLSFCIYINPQPQQFLPLTGNQTLLQVREKYLKANKPMEMYYSWKKP